MKPIFFGLPGLPSGLDHGLLVWDTHLDKKDFSNLRECIWCVDVGGGDNRPGLPLDVRIRSGMEIFCPGRKLRSGIRLRFTQDPPARCYWAKSDLQT
jgi:hypothetical protein